MVDGLKRRWREWLRMRANAPAQDPLTYVRQSQQLQGRGFANLKIALIRGTYRRAAEIEEKIAHSTGGKKK